MMWRSSISYTYTAELGCLQGRVPRPDHPVTQRGGLNLRVEGLEFWSRVLVPQIKPPGGLNLEVDGTVDLLP